MTSKPSRPLSPAIGRELATTATAWFAELMGAMSRGQALHADRARRELRSLGIRLSFASTKKEDARASE
jgi:hypothetical protein